MPFKILFPIKARNTTGCPQVHGGKFCSWVRVKHGCECAWQLGGEAGVRPVGCSIVLQEEWEIGSGTHLGLNPGTSVYLLCVNLGKSVSSSAKRGQSHLFL